MDKLELPKPNPEQSLSSELEIIRTEKRGEFVLKSERSADGQNLEIRTPHQRSGLEPLVFFVRIYGRAKSDTQHPHHEIIIEQSPVSTLVAKHLTKQINNSNNRYPDHSKYQFIHGIVFDSTEPDIYKIYSQAGSTLSSRADVIKVGQDSDNKKYKVDEQNGRLVFETSEPGANPHTISIPKDLKSFLGHLGPNGKFIQSESDLIDAVEFTTDI